MQPSAGNGPPTGVHRRGAFPHISYPSFSALMRFFLLLCCLVPNSVAAAAAASDEFELASEPNEPVLLIDHRLPVFIDGQWQIMSGDDHFDMQRELMKRSVAARSPKQEAAVDGNGDVTSTIQFTPPTGKPTATPYPTKTTTQTTASATPAVNSPLPNPFDGALAANFSTDSCSNFIEAFLNDPTFKACYPFSLLLQGSKSFFDAQKSFIGITRVLDATCAADVNSCSAYMDKLAGQLVAESNCAEDYRKSNALVVQAYMGMRAYKTLYSASCLTDPASSAYCFANAVTDLTSTGNYYLYYLPLNKTYPPDAQPLCNSCTQQTMGIYQAATADRRSSIAYTYSNASILINQDCGAGFVNETLPEPFSSKNDAISSRHGSNSLCLLVTLVAVVVSRWV